MAKNLKPKDVYKWFKNSKDSVWPLMFAQEFMEAAEKQKSVEIVAEVNGVEIVEPSYDDLRKRALEEMKDWNWDA